MIDFSDLYKKYAMDVFRFALYLSGNRNDAEDITSETFVRAFASSDRIQLATVKAYLIAIARNLFLMGIRKSARHVELRDTFHDSRPTAYDQVERKAELGALLASLQTLPEANRAALLMRTLDELPYEAIARILKISVASAKVKVHRARAALLKIRKEMP